MRYLLLFLLTIQILDSCDLLSNHASAKHNIKAPPQKNEKIIIAKVPSNEPAKELPKEPAKELPKKAPVDNVKKLPAKLSLGKLYNNNFISHNKHEILNKIMFTREQVIKYLKMMNSRNHHYNKSLDHK